MEPKAKPRLRSKGTELAPAAAGRREGPAAAGGDLSAAAAAAASMGPIPSLGHANLDGALANPGLRNWGSPSALRWLVGDWEISLGQVGVWGRPVYIGGKAAGSEHADGNEAAVAVFVFSRVGTGGGMTVCSFFLVYFFFCVKEM